MKTFFIKPGLNILIVAATITSCSEPIDRIYFSRTPEPPVVITNQPEDISTSSVYLSGQVVRNGSSSISRCGFNIYPTGVPVSMDPSSSRPFQDYRYASASEGYFSIFIRNLQPNTTYNYRAVASNNEGTSYGELMTFITAVDSLAYKKNGK